MRIDSLTSNSLILTVWKAIEKIPRINFLLVSALLVKRHVHFWMESTYIWTRWKGVVWLQHTKGIRNTLARLLDWSGWQKNRVEIDEPSEKSSSIQGNNTPFEVAWIQLNMSSYKHCRLKWCILHRRSFVWCSKVFVWFC